MTGERAGTPPAAGPVLPFGTFFGRLDVRRQAGGFELALRAPDPLWSVARHAHAEAHFVLVLSGLYVSSAEGADAVGRGPMLVYTPAGAVHRDHFEPRSRVIAGRFLSVSVPATLVAAAAREAATAGGRLPERSVVLRSPTALAAAERLASECARWAPDAPLVAEGLGLTLLAAAGHPGAVPGHPARQVPRWLGVVREMLDDHVAGGMGRVDTADLARESGVHPVHLARVFRRYMGCAPGDYVRRRRVERARVLLRATTRPLADVALSCGYADQSHLANAFKRHTGMTPGLYRSQA